MVVVTREVECIVQDNVRYCEKEEISPREMGLGILFVVISLVLLIGYIVSLVELDFKFESNGKIVIIGVLVPVLLLALILII